MGASDMTSDIRKLNLQILTTAPKAANEYLMNGIWIKSVVILHGNQFVNYVFNYKPFVFGMV
ncbi:hypothetical protein GCM10027275_03210 [Rhabdobacter roseus]